MHGLDHYIEDIEPRLCDILNNSYNSDVASLQTSLASYGWILLDAWITWRTARFLLRNTVIEIKKDKWIQTPSSYSGNQLVAAWNFSEGTRIFLCNHTGKASFKELIDNTVQAKRNSFAHMNGKEEVRGTDIVDIRRIFSTFSIVFLAYETSSFIDAIKANLWEKGYHNFTISLDGKTIKENITENLDEYSKANEILISCSDGTSCHYELLFDKDGCLARKKIGEDSKYEEVT